VDSKNSRDLAMTVYADEPPVGHLVMVSLANDLSVMARWDGMQWWTDTRIPIANEFVINWRTVN
jgi:hypothetical protein